jgi:PAS domain-containing protein
MDVDLLAQYTADRTPEERFQVLKGLLSSISEGFILADATGKFILWNAKATKILGKGPLDHAAPTKWPDFYGCYHEDMVTPILSEDLPLVRALGGVAVEDMVIYINNDNKKAWIMVSAIPVQLMNQTGGMVLFRDITAVKESEFKAAQVIKSLKEVKEQQLEILRTI